MPLRNARPIPFKPVGVSDAVDGTNSPPGSLYAAVNLTPSMHTRSIWVPRPAISQIIQFANPTGNGEALIEIGDRVWGMVQQPSNTYQAGYWNQMQWNVGRWGPQQSLSTPFCWDYATSGFVPIAGAAPPNLPVSTSNDGDWIPPTIAQIGAYLVFTHPGFQPPNMIGWIDQTGFSDHVTGYTTLYSPVITGFSEGGFAKDPFQAGWRPGQMLNSPAFPPNTRIVSVAEPGITLGATEPTVTVNQGALSTGQTNISVAGGTPANPLWAAGNINGYPLPSVPKAVAMFNGRAWFACKNAAVFSDAGDPLQRSQADAVITIQNGLDITAFATQPFSNQTVIGGVMNALVVFQADSGIWQITGDATTANLALNFSSAEGTLAPNTIVTVPGPALRFIAPDGMRQLNLDGSLSPPITTHGDGVAQPFIDCPYPSRMAAAYNEDTYRVSVSGYVAIGGSVVPEQAAAEYWYLEKLKAWSGPHTCVARLIAASQRPATGHGFLMFRLGPTAYVLGSGFGWVLGTNGGTMLGTGQHPIPQNIWFSATKPMIDSTYLEDAEPILWVFQTSMLPDSATMFMNAMLETSVACAIEPGQSIDISAVDERGVTIDTVQLVGFQPAANGTQLPTTGRGALFAQRQVDWHTTIEAKQASLVLRGTSNASVALGNINLRVQRTGYMLQDPGRITTMQPSFGVP